MPTPQTADPTVALPPGFTLPVDVALARAAETIPASRALPGRAQYEPKWDGFRLVIVRDTPRTTLWSRHGTDLTASFPDLAATAAEQLPPGTVLDGEAVVWTDGRLDFDSLQRRLTSRGTTLHRLVRRTPAVYVAFDLLAAAGHDLRAQPLRTRRALLEELARDLTGALQLSPASTDPAQAQTWFAELPTTGIEGLVVKGRNQPYTGGQRSWVKVKHRDTIEVVCAAITGTLTRPEELVVGRPIDGALQIVGRSTPLQAAAARALARSLQPPSNGHPWPADLSTKALNRYARSDASPRPVTLVEPIVVEIAADTAVTGASFRHAVRYLRTRPELAVADLQPLARAS